MPLTRIVGRDNTVAALATQLAQRRLLTIVGPGGIGKTTVAVAVAEAVTPAFADGVWFVGLASLPDPDLVPSAVSTVLGISQSGANPVTGLAAWLRDKHALIVLDSCEYVIGAVAPLAEAILKAAPQVHVLATSREQLRAEGEWLHRLASLELPPQTASPSADEVMQYSAVQLFDDRARATVDGFVLDDSDVPAVLEICRRLDGVPLALELAAARVDAFDVKGLAAQLDDRFAVLTKGRRTALPQHQTLRATMDWSYDLLSEIEQLVFRRLAVFQGDFTMDAAAAVAVDERIEAANVIEGIANLAGKSLVTTDISGDVTCHRLLDTTRSYALEKLAESGERERIVRRHAEHYRSLFERAEGEAAARPSGDWLADDAREIDNLRAALDWSFSQDGDPALGLNLIAASAPLWFRLSLNSEYRRRVERALRLLSDLSEQDSLVEMRLQIALGHALWYTQSDAELLQQAFARALELADRIGEAPDRSLALAGAMGNVGGSARPRSVSGSGGARDKIRGSRPVGRRSGFRSPGRQNPGTEPSLSGQSGACKTTYGAGAKGRARQRESSQHGISTEPRSGGCLAAHSHPLVTGISRSSTS